MCTKTRKPAGIALLSPRFLGDEVLPKLRHGDAAGGVVVRDFAGWPLGFREGGDEPRIRDLEPAKCLGYARPTTIRELIGRLVSGGKLYNIHQLRTVRRWDGQVAPRPEAEFWLTEAQALKVAAKSETEPADALLDEMIRVFMLARRGTLPRVRPYRRHRRGDGEGVHGRVVTTVVMVESSPACPG